MTLTKLQKTFIASIKENKEVQNALHPHRNRPAKPNNHGR